jgi:hypothetical protein
MSEKVPGQDKKVPGKDKEKEVPREEAPSVEPVSKQTWSETGVEELEEGADAPPRVLADCEGGCVVSTCEACYGDRCMEPPPD